MVICKFYLQGTCRFGENCKNEHVINGPAQGSSILRQQSFNPGGQQQQSGSQVDNNTLIKSVQTDMSNAEKGGQWIFSSYAPFKDKATFPGFEDQSFEEVRLGFYDARKNGMEDKYKQDIQQASQEIILKMKSLQNPNLEATKLLIDIYHTPPGSGKVFSASPNLFTQTSGNIFGGAASNVFNQSQNSVFGGANNPSQNVFATNQNSIFGAQQPSSGFGTNTPSGGVAPGQNVFGKSSVFGGGSQSAFGSPSTFGAQPTSVFGGQQSSPFQSSASIFANNSQNTVFGQNSSVFSNPTVQSSSLFGQQSNSASTFGNTVNQTTAGSLFGGQTQQQQPGGSFGQPATSASAFSGTSFTSFRAPQNSTSGGSIFGGAATTPTSSTSIFANAVASFNAAQNSNAPFGGASSNPPAFGNVAPTSSGSLFGASSGSSVFGTAPISSSSVFGSAPTTTSSVFGSAPTTTSVFGATAPQHSNTSVFGATPNNPSVFNPGSFNTTATTAPSGNIFANALSASTNSPFGNMQSPTLPFASSANTPSVFSPQPQAIFAAQQTNTPPAFSQQSSGSLFGSQASVPNQSVFAGSSPVKPTGPSSGSMFSGALSQNTGVSHTASIFGANPSSTGNTFGGGNVSTLVVAFNKTFYSNLEDLTEEEINCFKADAFEFGMIPNKPPPLELCS